MPKPRLQRAEVPIRFRPEVIDQVEVVAAQEGLTVSSWIRVVIARAVAVRLNQMKAPVE